MSADNDINSYKHLAALLHKVRWVQRFAAIIAEVLILLAFLASGMDISLGGVMANTTAIKWAWAMIFSLGADSSFVISWVRCRQLGRSWHLLWSIPVALAISFVVFEPVVIQLLQQALNIDFIQALSELGIDLTILVYARAAVAVFLGAILAITNVESGQAEQRAFPGPQRKIVLFERLLNRIAPVVNEEPAPAPIEVSQATLPEQVQAPVQVEEPPAQVEDEPPIELPAPTPQPAPPIESIPQDRAEKVRQLDLGSLSNAERVARVLALFPDISDRELGRLSGVSAATAKKYRLTLTQQ